MISISYYIIYILPWYCKFSPNVWLFVSINFCLSIASLSTDNCLSPCNLDLVEANILLLSYMLSFVCNVLYDSPFSKWCKQLYVRCSKSNLHCLLDWLVIRRDTMSLLWSRQMCRLIIFPLICVTFVWWPVSRLINIISPYSVPIIPISAGISVLCHHTIAVGLKILNYKNKIKKILNHKWFLLIMIYTLNEMIVN